MIETKHDHDLNYTFLFLLKSNLAVNSAVFQHFILAVPSPLYVDQCGHVTKCHLPKLSSDKARPGDAAAVFDLLQFKSGY